MGEKRRGAGGIVGGLGSMGQGSRGRRGRLERDCARIKDEVAEKRVSYRGVSQMMFLFSKKSKNGVKSVKGVI